MKLQNSSANSFFKRETFSPPQASSNKTISSAIPRNYSCYSPHKAARREGDETRTRFACLKLRLYFSRLCRSRVMAGNFPARNPVNRRRRCGRSWADTFEREPVVGAEMGGHGEARLAGPDTAIYRSTRDRDGCTEFRAPRILSGLRLLFRAASDSKRQIGREKKSIRP